MRLAFALIFVLVFSYNSFAQTELERRMVATITFSNFAASGSGYKGLIIFNDQTNEYNGTDVLVGDIIIQNSNAAIFRLDTVYTTTLSKDSVFLTEITSKGVAPIGRGQIERRTTNYGLSLFSPDNQNGISSQLLSIIQTSNIIKIDSLLSVSGGGGNTFDHVAFDTSSTHNVDVGEVAWNDQEGTLDLGLLNGSVLQIGQEQPVLVKNKTGSTIPDGTPLRFVGTEGNSGRILVAPAIADGSYSSYYNFGAATQEILNDEVGYATPFGKIRGVDLVAGNTDLNCNAEVWGDSTILYLDASTPGCYTKVKPTGANQKIPFAAIISAGNNGSMFVRPTLFAAIEDISGVEITNPANGQVIGYDNGVWVNKNEETPDSNLFVTTTRLEDSLASNLAKANNYADELAFSTGSYISKDTTVTIDFTVIMADFYTITSFCDAGVDNTISLPTPVDSLRGNVVEVTHLDTSAAQSRTTTVETDGTSYHIYDNFTGDTLTFFNIYQSGQTVRFTLKEIEGVLRWVAVDLSPVVFGDKELTAVGKIRQGDDGDLYAYDSSVSGERELQYQYLVDSVEEILTLKLELGDRIKVKGTGAEYLVQTGSVSGYATDSIAVIDLNNSFAVLQPQNNAYFIEWFGAVSGDAINDSEAIQKSINFLRAANGNTIKSQSNNSKFIVNDNINIDLFGGKNLHIEIQDTLYRAPSANFSGYLFSVNRSERVHFKYLTIASDNEFPSSIPAHNPAGCVDETCNLTSNFNGIAIGNIGDNGNVIIDNCTFLNLGFAIDANGTQQIEVSNSVMIGCYFGITGGGNSSIVVNNLFHGVDSLQTIENTPHTLYLNNYLNVAVNNLHCGGEYQGQMYSSLDTPIKIGNSVSKDTASLNFNNINIFVPSTTDRGCSGRIVIEAIPVNSNWNNITSTNLVHSGPIFMSIFGVTKGVNASNVILNWPKSTGGTLLDFNAADQSANFSNLIVEGSAKINLRNNNLFNCVNCSYENPREKIFTGTDITQTSYANYTNLSVSFIDSNSVNLFDVRNSIIQVDGLNIRIDNATASTIAEVREGSNVPRRFIRIHNAILDTLYSDVGQLIDTPGYTSTEPAFFIDGRYTDGSVISLSNTPYLDELDEIVLPKNIKSTGSALFGTGQTQNTSISNGDIAIAGASAIRKASNNLLMASSPTYQRIQFYGSNHRVAVMNEDGLSLASRPTEATNFPSATLDINGTFKLTGDADFPELDTLQSQNTTLRDTTAATAAFTIRIGEENHINTTGGSVTAQVPAGAQIGNVFSVYAGESAGTNSATIDFVTNGYTVLGASVSRILNTNFQYETYRYVGDGNWIIISKGP